MGGLREAYYKPLSIYVLDPLEYTALGLHILKGMNGEARWAQCQADRWKHPDGQKIACVFNGALIYTAAFPERTHKDMRPPLDWLVDSGVTLSAMAEAKQHLMADDPDWAAKRDFRQELNEAMDGDPERGH